MKKKLNIKKVVLVVTLLFALAIAGIFGFKVLFSNEDSSSNNPNTTDKPTSKEPDNEFSSLAYYHQDKLERYTTYKNSNPSLSIEDIVTHVNMGIDVPFYSTDPIAVKDGDDLTVLINKVYKLPDGWAPSDLKEIGDYKGQSMRKEACDAFKEFAAACKKQGFDIFGHSGYRSTEFQKKIYNNMIDTYGQEYTDKYVSRPGQSEHTTGLSVDVSIDGMPYEDIESSSHYAWFKEQLSNYGFILRYPKDKEALTGYNYESWHIRYLGKELAKKVEKSGLTYDEYVAREL